MASTQWVPLPLDRLTGTCVVSCCWAGAKSVCSTWAGGMRQTRPINQEIVHFGLEQTNSLAYFQEMFEMLDCEAVAGTGQQKHG